MTKTLIGGEKSQIRKDIKASIGFCVFIKIVPLSFRLEKSVAFGKVPPKEGPRGGGITSGLPRIINYPHPLLEMEV